MKILAMIEMDGCEQLDRKKVCEVLEKIIDGSNILITLNDAIFNSSLCDNLHELNEDGPIPNISAINIQF